MQKTFLRYTAVVLWMAVIFALSSQAAEQSNRLSTGVTEMIIEVVERAVPAAEFDLQTVNHFIRKNAHFFAYLILGVLVMNALKGSRCGGYKSFMMALGICVLYAVSDEVHQLFVPGRGAQVKDVLLDSTGAAVGIVLYKYYIYKSGKCPLS